MRAASSFSNHNQMSLWGEVLIGAQMNKFKRVSSDHDQMSLADDRSQGLMSKGLGPKVWPIALCIYCYLSPPPPDRQTQKTLPSHNFICGR